MKTIVGPTRKFGLSRLVPVGLGAGALAVALLAIPADAQQKAPHPPGPGPGDHFAPMCENADARRAGMLAFAETKLGITAQERSAWDQFVQRVTASAAPMKQVCADIAGKPEPTALPDHLARMEQIAEATTQQLRQLRPAVTEMYNVLTPEQKTTADEMVGKMMHDMHH